MMSLVNRVNLQSTIFASYDDLLSILLIKKICCLNKSTIFWGQEILEKKRKIRNFEKEMRNCGQYIELILVLHIPHNIKGFTLCLVTSPAVP